jgi:hypothetical protein
MFENPSRLSRNGFIALCMFLNHFIDPSGCRDFTPSAGFFFQASYRLAALLLFCCCFTTVLLVQTASQQQQSSKLVRYS